MTADDWCAYPRIRRDPASTLDLPRGEDDGSAASRASRVAMARVKVPSACCEFDEDARDGGDANEDRDGLIEVDVTIDVDRGVIESVREATRTRTTGGGGDGGLRGERRGRGRASSGDGREDVLTDVRGHTHTHR